MKPLDPIQTKFILHWGEMGTRWGVNRTVAQIHALLFISEEPLPAEQLAEALSVARSNVSNSLKELQSWGVVKRVHVIGDKRDHFESMKDPWDMFRVVLEERKKREIDPTMEVLQECLAEGSKTNDYTRDQLKAMTGFFQSTMGWYQQVIQWPTTTLKRFVSMGDKLLKLIGKS